MRASLVKEGFRMKKATIIKVLLALLALALAGGANLTWG
ncbi:hypothetical protein J2Z80_001392 [Thermoanaerobacterium butyriciformans]|uniref:Uncharacterized protein n=1 Tax=Thermoanaerobacterium butyriciformans TaxID=1702242 RepID=A0ABS4NDX1_9THEO|nr:hypothetical protein [Thermoanaerobacterium butyriciformans]